ncbi:hypothetical protein [Blastopirellula marina]|uniref:Uncharacterized protein n=1 Tax=Blastopirellula marina TaxID=124 RepID=A0A2S8GS20_9BACT|nr:hypothetical protein [Blastopirellula marina]PQO47228.1 hypothetical protein C5Y93_04090 [Blastopirellula marina]
MVDMAKRQEYVAIYQQGASAKRAQGDLLGEQRSLSSLWLNYLAMAVVECGDVDEAQSWWATNVPGTLLERFAEVTRECVAQVDAGVVPASTIAGNYPHLVLTHLAWALGNFSLGEQFAEIAVRPDVLPLSTPFWREYARAIAALIAGSPYAVATLKLKGLEKYWHAYLPLIDAATNAQDLEAPLFEIDESFRRRNADKRIKQDQYEIEGSGGRPARWDFRRDGLVRYLDARK